MAVKDGSNVWVVVAGSVVNGLTSKSLDLSADEIDVTTQDDAGWKSFLAGEASGVLTFECNDDESDTYAYDSLATAMLAKNAVAFAYGEGIKTPNKCYIYGNAIITSLTKSDPKNSAGTFSCTLRLTGSPTFATTTTTLA